MIHAATRAGTLSGLYRTPSRIVSSKPKVAVASPNHWPGPVRSFSA